MLSPEIARAQTSLLLGLHMYFLREKRKPYVPEYSGTYGLRFLRGQGMTKLGRFHAFW